MTPEKLAQEWLKAKSEETAAIAQRRDIEDQMVKSLAIPKDHDGTKNFELGVLKVKIVGRLDRKVDATKVQELAAEHGLTEHLSSLFRWKPEINAAIWKNADESITKPLLGAITTTSGRPSFSIETSGE